MYWCGYDVFGYGKTSNKKSGEMTGELNEGNNSVNRRTLLKGLSTVGGVAAFGTIGFPSASAKETTEAMAKIDFTDLKGAKREKAISRVLSDTGYKQLKSRYVDSGWRPAINDATATKSQTPSERHLSVVIPFVNEDSNNREEVNILWENSGDSPTLIGFHSTDGDTEHTVISSTIKSGNVVTEHNSIPAQQVGTNDHTTPPSGGSDCPPGEYYTPSRRCKSVNWQCVLRAAGTFATAFGACGKCNYGDVFACYACVGAILLFADTSISCDIGDDCHTEWGCNDYPVRS